MRRALPRHLIVLPGDGWLPLIAGLGTAGFFLLLTVKWVVVAWLCAAMAIVALLRWLWASDRDPGVAAAEVAQGVVLPVGARGTRSHSWWGTLVLVVVDLTIFAALLFAHLHVSMQAEVCPPPGAALPPVSWSLAAGGGWLASAAAMLGLLRAAEQPRWRVAAATMVALLLVGAASSAAVAGHVNADLSPRGNAWSATVAVLLAWQVLHAVVLVAMGGYLIARTCAGLLTPHCHATRDNVVLFWCSCATQGLVATIVVGQLPSWLG
jgi:cytochrome c oxidase subunit I+III